MTDNQKLADGHEGGPAKAGDAISLLYPVELKNTAGAVMEVVSAVTLRRLTGSDLAAVSNAGSGGQGDVLRTMICRACQITPLVFDRLDAEDVMRLSGVVNTFFASVRPTGAT